MLPAEAKFQKVWLRMATDPKSFLYSARNEVFEIKELQLRIENLETQASGLKAISYDSVHVQTSPQDVMSSKIAELMDYREKLSSKIAHLNFRRQQAQEMIDTLADTRERQVLDLYFLSDSRMSMSAVARAISYSERETYLIYQMALSHLCSDLQ